MLRALARTKGVELKTQKVFHSWYSPKARCNDKYVSTPEYLLKSLQLDDVHLKKFYFAIMWMVNIRSGLDFSKYVKILWYLLKSGSTSVIPNRDAIKVPAKKISLGVRKQKFAYRHVGCEEVSEHRKLFSQAR